MPFVSGLLWIPYLLQLLCILHILKTQRNMYWIWIIIMLPYIGGIAYFIIEILPGLSRGNSVTSIQDSIVYFIRPKEKIEALRRKAEFSPTHNNCLEYADALLSGGEYTKALELYTAQNKGLFKDDVELQYKIAFAEYKSGHFSEAKTYIKKIQDQHTKLFKHPNHTLLYCAIIENTESPDTVKTEYKRILTTSPLSSLELHYLQYLTKKNDIDEVLQKIKIMRTEEDAMKKNHMRYNKRFYHEAYRLEREINEQLKRKKEDV